jgi:sirohydrochlorin ferrochelatase
LLEGWSSALAERRGSAVWMQPLTADPIALPAAQPLLLVPLLLTPGSHVRHDLPAIRDRLRAAGHPVVSLPFLGSWAPWLEHLAHLASATGSRSLLHHPLRPGVADRYLGALSRRLELEPVSADRQDAQRLRPLPLALAPNRMTAQLQAEGLEAPALLERPATQDLLFQLLLSLP